MRGPLGGARYWSGLEVHIGDSIFKLSIKKRQEEVESFFGKLRALDGHDLRRVCRKGVHYVRAFPKEFVNN